MSIWKDVQRLVLGDRMTRGDADRWWQARTLGDLGELTALWLEGKIASQPPYAANYGPDEETTHLVPVLAAANRAGYLTHQSQPGVPPEAGYDGETWCQRAAVCGYASEELARRIDDACTAAGMIVHVHSPRRRNGRDWTPVTTRAGQTVTGFGRRIPLRGSGIRFLYGGTCHPDAVNAIADAHQVTVIDPEWGRDDWLWPALTVAVGALYSVKDPEEAPERTR